MDSRFLMRICLSDSRILLDFSGFFHLRKIKGATRILPREVRIYQGNRKNVSEAVKLAQKENCKQWYVKTAAVSRQWQEKCFEP